MVTLCCVCFYSTKPLISVKNAVTTTYSLLNSLKKSFEIGWPKIIWAGPSTRLSLYWGPGGLVFDPDSVGVWAKPFTTQCLILFIWGNGFNHSYPLARPATPMVLYGDPQMV